MKTENETQLHKRIGDGHWSAFGRRIALPFKINKRFIRNMFFFFFDKNQVGDNRLHNF